MPLGARPKVGVLLQASVDLLNLPSERCSFLASMVTTLQQNVDVCMVRPVSDAFDEVNLRAFLDLRFVAQLGTTFRLASVLPISTLSTCCIFVLTAWPNLRV